MPISSFGHPNVLHACISLENELLETFPDIFADVLSCFIPRVSMPSPGGGARVVASRTTYSSTTGYVAAAMILSGSRRRWGTYGHGNAAGSGECLHPADWGGISEGFPAGFTRNSGIFTIIQLWNSLRISRSYAVSTSEKQSFWRHKSCPKSPWMGVTIIATWIHMVSYWVLHGFTTLVIIWSSIMIIHS